MNTSVAQSVAAAPKRILFMTHVGDPGGAELKMIDLCREMRPCAEVLLLQNGSLEGLLAKERVGVQVCPMPAATRQLRKEGGPASILRAIPGALSMVREVARRSREFDVIVCFSQKSFVVASLAKLITRRPILWFMNDILSPEHFSRTLIRMLVVLSRFSANHIVLNSRASLRAWLDSRGRKRAVSVIYPGVAEAQVDAQLRDATRVADYRSRYSPNGLPLIGMFGRISRWKGQDVFLRAIAQVPGVNAVIAGGALFGEADLECRLRELSRELGIEDRVTFAGHIEDPLALMAACNVVAHCSTAPEPFGLVIAEAMLAGTPVVASDAGGVREIVQPGETGVVTPPKDHAALARAIRGYLEQPDWAKWVARNARAAARVKFTATAMTSGFRHVIEGL